jgi:zinc protease
MNGLNVVTHHGLPIAHLTLYFPGGPAHDPVGKEGLTTLCNRALIRGTVHRDRAAVEEAIEQLGSELLTSTQGFAVGLGGSVLSRALPAFLEHLGEVVTAPAFDAEEIAKTQREMQAQLRSVWDDDAMLGRRWLRQALFHGTRFAHGALGRRDTLPTLTPDDVRAHYARMYARENLLISASGDVTAEQLLALTAPIRAGLPSGAPVEWTQAAPAPLSDRAAYIVDKTDRTQAQVFIGQPTVPAHHADTLALHVATTAFGGTFTSRLMQEVRVKRGLSYGAHARLAAERVCGTYLLTAAPEVAEVPQTVGLLLDEYRRFVEEGLSDAEIDFARTHLLHAFAFAVETPTLRAVQAVRARLLGCPTDHVETYCDRLQALSCAQIRAAVRRWLTPERLAVVVVGPAGAIHPRLAELPQLDRVHRVRPWDPLPTA